MINEDERYENEGVATFKKKHDHEEEDNEASFSWLSEVVRT